MAFVSGGGLTRDGLHGDGELLQAQMQQIKVTGADESGLVGVVSDTGERADGGGGGEAAPMTGRSRRGGKAGCGVHVDEWLML